MEVIRDNSFEFSDSKEEFVSDPLGLENLVSAVVDSDSAYGEPLDTHFFDEHPASLEPLKISAEVPKYTLNTRIYLREYQVT